MMTNKNLTLPPDWKKNVSRMWQCVRKHDCDIPSEDLDLMREILLQAQPPTRTKLTPTPTEENPRQWYFDCDGLYIDVEDLNGEVSIFVRNRIDGSVGWKELIEKPAPEGVDK